MLRAFERSRSSSAVADVIETTGRSAGRDGRARVHSVFCQARLGRGVDGAWAGPDDASTWERYLRRGDGLRVVARADPRPGSGPIALPAGLRVVPLPYYVGVRQLAGRAIPLAVSIARAVRAADTIILRLPGVIGAIGAALCLLMRRRYAVEVVGDPREVLSTGVLGRGGRLLASGVAAYMRWAVRRADAVLYVTAERLQRRYPSRRGAAEAGMADVVLCADAFVAAPRRWAPGCARIIAVGSQEQLYKGHDVLLRAVRRLLDAGVDVEAVIVGGGRMHVELQELAWSSGVANRVRFTGVIQDRARLVAELDRATVFAMPSRTEGLPRALVEAMARGLPAVGTDVGGIPELLDSRCIVRPDDDRALAGALAELLRHADLWEEQSRRNLDVARGFRVEALRLRFESRLENAPAAAGKRRSRSA